MQPASNHGAERAREEIDLRFNRITTPKVFKPALLPDQYSTAPVPPVRVPDPRRLGQQRPVR